MSEKLYNGKTLDELINIASRASESVEDYDTDWTNICKAVAEACCPDVYYMIDGDEVIRVVDGWIDVEDKLPEHYKTVIVSGGTAHYEGDIKKTWFSHESESVIQWKVTHWMPLPRLPLVTAP